MSHHPIDYLARPHGTRLVHALDDKLFMDEGNNEGVGIKVYHMGKKGRALADSLGGTYETIAGETTYITLPKPGHDTRISKAPNSIYPRVNPLRGYHA